MYANPQEVVDCETFNGAELAREFEPEGRDRLYFEKQHVQMPDYERALAALNELCPERGRLLEIGSYLGLLLERCRKNRWEVTGLEPFSVAADYARKKYGFNIVEAVLPEAKFPEASFDAVLMLHVIEHMPDPALNVGEIHRVLKPGGVLVVETPRFDSLMFKLLGRRERSINNCPGHIYFFAVPTLRRLLEKNGFEVLRVDLVGRTLTLERLLYNVGVMSRSQKVRAWTDRMGTKLGLNRFRVHVNARDMQRIFCRAKPVSVRKTDSDGAGRSSPFADPVNA
jgi:SAM-dependent methyltransferase